MNRNPLQHCAKCGSELPAGVPAGLCPCCALAGTGTNDASALSSTDEGQVLLELPRDFGDYEMLEEIARGGMGVVFKARQKSLDRIVAVKMLLSGTFASDELIRRFKVEATSTASLRHSNIVAIHEVGLRDSQHFLVMDYVDGPNLATLVRNEPLSPKRAATFVKIIADAIHYAHEKDILHRDLKPSNILVDSNDQPHVTDFGLARHIDGESSLTLSGQVLGSLNYMPPEQAAAHHQKVSRQSDVYGLGAVLYHLLTGRPPFQGSTMAETVQKVMNTEPTAPKAVNPAVPRDLETVCLKCLEKEPERRYATAQEVADELSRFLNGEAVHARPISRSERIFRWGRKRPITAALAAAVIVLSLVGLAGLIVAKERTRAAERARTTARAILSGSDTVLIDLALRETNQAHSGEILRGLHDARPRQAHNPLYWRALAAVAERTNGLSDALPLLAKAADLAGTNARPIRTEALLKRSELLRRMGRFAEAGLDFRRAHSLVLPALTNRWENPEPPPDYHAATTVYAELGTTNKEAGLYLFYSRGDGKHAPAALDGQECRLFYAKEGVDVHYGYFIIDPTFKWRGRGAAVVRVEYRSNRSGRFGVDFDSHQGPYHQVAVPVQLRSSSEWRVADFRLANARFANSQNEKADFRLWIESADLYVRRVELFDHNPPDQPPVASHLPEARPADPLLKSELARARPWDLARWRAHPEVLLEWAGEAADLDRAQALLSGLEKWAREELPTPERLLAQARVLEQLGRDEEALAVLDKIFVPSQGVAYSTRKRTVSTQRRDVLLKLGRLTEAGSENCRRLGLQLRHPTTPTNQIDLSPFYTGSMRFLVTSDLEAARHAMIAGVKRYTGVDFDIRGCVELFGQGAARDGFGRKPSSFHIPINMPCRRLFFLHTASYRPSEGKQISSFVMRLADGSTNEVPIIYGADVRVISGDSRTVTRARLAWVLNEEIRNGIKLNNRHAFYLTEWVNPSPATPVESVRFVSKLTECSPLLIAITSE